MIKASFKLDTYWLITQKSTIMTCMPNSINRTLECFVNHTFLKHKLLQ